MDNVSKVGIWPTTIVVPADIHKALIRNKLRLSDYVKFDKVKSALSSTDIKHWYSVIDLVKIGGKKLGYPLMCQSGMDTGFPVPGFDQTHFDQNIQSQRVMLDMYSKHLNRLICDHNLV